jgi:NH3-dependent NAD+ synthetase
MPVIDGTALIENRVGAIRELHDSVGTLRAQLDVSGGIDSGVMLGLLSKALGPENVTAVYSSIHSGDEFRE